MSSTQVTRRPGGNGGGIVIPSDPETLGNILTASGFFADTKQAAQAAVKVMAGQELGFGPIASMTGVYIVKGRVTLSANLMAAAIKRSVYDYRVKEHTAEKCVVDFYGPKIDGTPGMELVGTSEFSMDDATAAGLANSDTYKKFPRNMLFSRALSNGAKWYCADVFGGGPAYTPDELTDEVTYDADGQVVAVVEDAVDAEPVVEAPTKIGPTATKQLTDQYARYEEAGLTFERLEMQVTALGGELDTSGEDSIWKLLTRDQGLAIYEWMQAEVDSTVSA